ncbi:MAG TPA: acetyl-CoA carboxylase biotin carboxylase subunit [Acidobacteriota bacterium]|nr:acetyl-CoA carboxylase biotin carboxylase subunit [Acidobacteriota bacterium]HOB51743.1 acetyl-CoA carboxylase biotin carboxylase subunit [Acidobacteriota bacterium]HQM62103.1 acetyl-CoA carboxylase biotin carboxylase subunit [Acidobacteriota bacterium]HQO24708.1 acetyl-CoA carboxylase biotin carboxylase subunit [Acidobacteriota bacterium]HQP73229.1 acetyl-CoA carboxylase biotin carboxylase subunit [Acidobacteriota bacterium]
MTGPIRKIVVANRGEIAVRIIRACREMGIRSVAVYSDADRAALHVRLADEAYPIGPPPAAESYLQIQSIIDVALWSRAQAVAPGYGFLAEREEFARRCEAVGLVFIGPSPDSIAQMGDKLASRRIAEAAGVPVIPGVQRRVDDPEEAAALATAMGFPVMLKASAGGGGKGLRLARSADEVRRLLPLTMSEALTSFGDDTVYIEKYVENPRHVEIQVLGDNHGHVIYLGERECTLQRRHQKVVEEAPSPVMTPELRRRMGEAAVRLARAVNYRNAGTVEFLVDKHLDFYFLEMNTRLQVEHPVTEMVTGIDLVKAQIRIAAGEPLGLRQEDVTINGWAMECRIYAEDPDNNFVPCPGRIVSLHEPSGPGVRNDNGMYEGLEITIYYDPLISKLISFAPTRGEAVDRMLRALKEFKIGGIKTNIPYFMRIFAHEDFRAGRFDTTFLDRKFEQPTTGIPGEETIEELERVAVIAAAVKYYRQVQGAGGPVAAAPPAAPSAWKARGRSAALRRGGR